MSRIGQKGIMIPEKTEVTVTEDSVAVKGPLGELSMKYNPVVEVKVEEGKVNVTPKDDSLETNALWGTYTSLINGMVEGVNKEFEKNLIIEGVGFRAQMKGSTLVLSVGFSHDVEMEIPEGVKVNVEGEKITVSGIDKQAVGQFAADVRSKKKPEPYKGKGIRFADEVVRRKEGKKTV
jgi:large subunit ribosomal protein L6